ncbi:ABC transporter substrate-binding protein [Nostoc sp. UHCC 0870]|uniref:ABC transporter substrate-binding protein n=1 Tax=Nostoc sp. UHCC 0870 TaxID=2914041 RepID=UPI001EE096EA|nr:AAA-like domain-containing protein [Nostoc sp. UHCC 0870]UKO97294.1 AAA-like domain-containing protein [Nostoc sp. UHCC 0870]
MNKAQTYYQVGGTLKPDTPSYIERQADKNLYKELKSGNFCYVFNSRQMGKSSLQVRVSKKLAEENFICVVISLDKFGTRGVTQLQWYNSLVKNLADTFNLKPEQLSTATPLHHLSDFFEKKLLLKINKNIVIFIDEIDTVLSLDFPTDDFFAFIRHCYNQRANNPIYERITFALLGVATPSQLIQDTQRTPFNIGEAIQLNGFSLQESQPLAKGLESKVNDPLIAEYIVREVLIWTSGQPFLTQKICKIIAEDANIVPSDEKIIPKWIEVFVKSRIIENWEYQDEPQHLRTIRNRIINSQVSLVKLLKFYLQVLQEKELPVNDSLEQRELILSGLLEEKNGNLKVYNLIYKEVFDAGWVTEMLADMKPYEEELLGWLSSNRQDKSWLLQGQDLQKAIVWCDGKILNIEDYQFINASQELKIANLGIKIQKKEHFQRLLAGITFSMIIIAGISGFQLQKTIQSEVFHVPYILEPELFSQGERTFFSGDGNFFQKQGVVAFKQGNYSKARELFQKSKNVDRNDPEAEIYYNNALAYEKQNQHNIKPLTIAVVVPIYARKESAISILRGVALAQNEFNENAQPQDRLLNVVIANDSNDPVLAQKVAKELIKDSNVLAVIGHNASNASKSALSEYEKAELAMISSSSASNELRSKVFFRTIYSNKSTAEHLADYAIKNKIKQVVIYYKSKDAYSDDIKENFATFFKHKGGEVKSSVDLSDQQQNSPEKFRSDLIDKNHPDAFVFFPNTELISAVIEMLRAKEGLPYISKDVMFLGGGTFYNSETLRLGKKYVEGLILPVSWSPEEQNSQKFAQKACERWEDKVSWQTASSYDATKAFIAAISKSDLSNKNVHEQRKDVIEKLKSVHLPANETSGNELKFIDGERKDAKPVLVRVVKGSSKDCGSVEVGGFHFKKLEEPQ